MCPNLRGDEGVLVKNIQEHLGLSENFKQGQDVLQNSSLIGSTGIHFAGSGCRSVITLSSSERHVPLVV